MSGDDAVEQWRKVGAEALGTFALTAAAAAPDVVSAALHVPVAETVKVVAAGLTVAIVIYTLGDISGAHINPVVTLGFALRRAFPWRQAPGYMAAQLLGATLAGVLLRLLFGDVGGLGASMPHTSFPVVLATEALLTAFLVSVILQAATRENLVGPEAAIPVGLMIVTAGLVAGPISGASMNPARSLGPVIAGGSSEGWWLYVLGPLLGSLIAVVLVYALRGRYSAKEQQSAQGEG
jgi:aquaporin Z